MEMDNGNVMADESVGTCQLVSQSKQKEHKGTVPKCSLYRIREISRGHNWHHLFGSLIEKGA